MSPEERHAQVRQKIIDGELPGRGRTKFRMALGRGASCSVCGETIKATAREYAFPGDPLLDEQCFRIWLDEIGGSTR